MTKTITLLFDNLNDARSAVAELEAIGLEPTDISIVSRGPESVGATSVDMTGHEISGQTDMTEDDASGGVASVHDAGKDAGTGAKLGGVVGGGAGLLAGLGMLALPGIGPVVAGGWLVSTLVGAVVGAAAGGAAGSLVGSLIQAGVSEEDAHVYAEGVRRGGALVGARVDDDRYGRAEAALRSYNGVDATTRGAAYRAGGWSGFDHDAQGGGDTTPRAGGESGSDDPAPLSHAIHAPTLADDPAPLSHLLHIPVLSDD